MTKSPSSKVGINSPPIVLNKIPENTNNARAPYNTFLVLSKAQVIEGRYQEFNFRMSFSEIEFGFSLVGFKNIEATTGT